MQTAARSLVLVGLAAALLFAWLGTIQSPVHRYSLDASAQRYVDEALKRALLTFGTARVIGAILSVAQGTEVAIEPGGVGVKFSPGQALHPINALVGQFADLMLAASIAFGAMEVLLRIGSYWVVTLALSIAAVAWSFTWWRKHAAPTWLARILIFLLLVRFAIPIVSLGSEGIYSAFMAEDYLASQRAIQTTTDQIGGEVAARSESKSNPGVGNRFLEWLSPKAASGSGAESKVEPGFVESVKNWWGEKGDVGARLKKFAQDAEKLSQHVVKLMVVFLLQTLVIPLILGWVLLRGASAVMQGGQRFREKLV